MKKTMRTLAVIGLVSIVAGFRLLATPLGLEATPHFPDLGAFNLDVSYIANGGANNFQAQGITGAYSIDSIGDRNPLFVGDWSDLSFDLTATITSAGHLSGGTLTILGSMDGTGDTVETLLTGALIAGNDGDATTFGSLFQASPNQGGDTIEFLFTVTGGDPSVMSDFGATGGITISPQFGVDTPTDWTASFSNSSQAGNADVIPYTVPEPSSILFVLVGSILFVRRHRCRRNA